MICDALYSSHEQDRQSLLENALQLARVDWLWELEEGQLKCALHQIVWVLQRNVDNCGWTYARELREGDLASLKESGQVCGQEGAEPAAEGWVPEDALNYNYESEPLQKKRSRSKTDAAVDNVTSKKLTSLRP